MAEYRDDTNEIMVAGDEVKTTSRGREDNIAKTGDELTYRLRVLTTDSATVTEQWTDKHTGGSQDGLPVADLFTGRLRAAGVGGDARRLVETLRHRIRAYTVEAVGIQDAITDQVQAGDRDSLGVSDEFTGRRRVTVLMEDSLGIQDASSRRASVFMEEVLAPSDVATGRLYAKVMMVEAMGTGDEQQESGGASDRVLEVVRIGDLVTGVLRAVQFIVDSAEITDEQARDEGYQSQAWTSNVDSWAMSRYAPYTFDSLAVIDGVLYGVASDGVYALDGGTGAIQGEIATGKMDIGGGGLVHPLAAFLEYELEGTATMDVTTTQSGSAETFTYQLPAEDAAELTNGRFVFGRGLRGRHFSFVLRLEGERAYINDLRVDTAPTKRRV